MKDEKEFSPSQKIDYHVMTDSNLSRETIREWMERDIKGAAILIGEVLRSKECIDALTDVFYKRYTELHESKKPVEQP